MKTLLALLITVFSVSGLGYWYELSSNSSWDEIFADNQIYIDEPKIPFNLTFVSVFKVCIEGDKFRTIHKVPVYHREFRSDENEAWSIVGHEHLYKPIHYQKHEKKCRGFYRGCEEKSYWASRPLVYKVALRSPYHSDDQTYGRLLFEKDWHLKTCDK